MAAENKSWGGETGRDQVLLALLTASETGMDRPDAGNKYELLKRAMEARRATADCPASVGPQVNLQALGDSIILFTDLQKPAGQIEAFVRCVSDLCREVVGRSGLRIRGGIAVGSYFHEEFPQPEDEFRSANALVKSYELDQLAEPPRVLLDEDLFRDRHLGEIISQYAETDADGHHRLNV